MGSALSISTENLIHQEVIRQKQLPLDGSDVMDLEKAKQELMRIRRLCHKLIPDEDNSTSSPVSPLTSPDLMTLALMKEVKLKIEERYDSLQEAFLAIDTNRSGFISQQEFKDACWRWGLPVDDHDFTHLNSLYPHLEKDYSIDRGITYLEFVALISKVLCYHVGSGEVQADSLHKVFADKVLSTGATMKESFKQLDNDGSGYLDKDEIKRIFKIYQIKYTTQEFDTLFEQYDINKDGLFCYGEFVKMLQSSQLKRNGSC